MKPFPCCRVHLEITVCTDLISRTHVSFHHRHHRIFKELQDIPKFFFPSTLRHWTLSGLLFANSPCRIQNLHMVHGSASGGSVLMHSHNKKGLQQIIMRLQTERQQLGCSFVEGQEKKSAACHKYAVRPGFSECVARYVNLASPENAKFWGGKA